MVKIMGRTLPVHIYTYQLPKDLECSLNSKLPYESNIMSPITEKQLLSGQWLRKASVMLIYNLRVCSFDLNNCIYNFLHRKNFLDIKSDGIISEKHPKTVICLRDKRMQDCKICCNKNCKSTFSAKLKNIDTRQDAIADTSSFNLNESYFILNDVKENEAVNLTNLLISQLEKFPKLQFKECVPKQIKTKSKMFLIDYKKELSNDLKELENCEESHLYDVMLGNECQMDQFHKFGFDLPLFLNSLHKKDKCPIICYADSVGSTLKISQNYFEKYCTVDTDILISANEQTCGVGRSSDKWISNRGQLVFTVIKRFGTTSRIVKYACLIQHMLSCAIVESINSIINYDSGLRLKWPNDIYYKRIAKIGGVIVQAQSLVSSTLITSSCGFNFTNKQPTLCLIDLINHVRLTKEVILAKTLDTFDEIINEFEIHGHERFYRRYYNLWMHKDEKTMIYNDGNKIEFTICGIDEYGYLKVCETGNLNYAKNCPNLIKTIYPSINTLDIWHGLIVQKV